MTASWSLHSAAARPAAGAPRAEVRPVDDGTGGDNGEPRPVCRGEILSPQADIGEQVVGEVGKARCPVRGSSPRMHILENGRDETSYLLPARAGRTGLA